MTFEIILGFLETDMYIMIRAQARRNSMPYFWRDDGDHMKLIDRKEKKVLYPLLQSSITAAAMQVKK